MELINTFLFTDRRSSCGSQPSVSTLRKEESIKAQKSSYIWRLSPSSWITSQILEVAGVRAPDGWKWQFRSYNEISEDSKAVHYAETGDLKGLQELFASKQASPFDRVDTTGYTLLFVSIAGSPLSLSGFERHTNNSPPFLISMHILLIGQR
jgi:hypothetical protein